MKFGAAALTALTALAALPLSQVSAHAQEPRAFCEGFSALFSAAPDPQPGILTRLRMALLPRTLIHPGKLTQLTRPEGDDEGDDALETYPRVIFVQLPAPRRDPEILRKLSEQKQAAAELPLLQALRKVRTTEGCLAEVESRPEQFEALSTYLELFEKAQPALEAEQAHALRDLLLSKLSAFERRGWRIELTTDLFEMYRTIEQTPSIREVMIVAHSDELGRLYDSSKNIFPKGAFANLPGRITKLVIYSCHSQKVAEYYGASQLLNQLDYLYPEIRQGVARHYGSTIPVAAIRGMLRSAGRPPRDPSHERSCSVRITMPEARRHLIITLNGSLIGAKDFQAQTELPVDCALTAASDTVKIYYLGTDQRPALSVSSITLRKQDSKGEFSERTLTIREFVSSQTGNHLLTQGT